MKKYSISSEIKTSHGIVGGYTDYATINELVSAYLDRKNEGIQITNVGLSLDYINSLNYLERENIVERDLLEVLDIFEVCGINDFRLSFGRLFYK